jgi:hypothetical protein
MCWKLSRSLASIAILVALSHGPAHAQQPPVEVCTGENANGCPGAHSAWYPCGVSPEQAARMVCTTYTASGTKVLDFRFTIRYIVAGGQCGYAGITVTCVGQ